METFRHQILILERPVTHPSFGGSTFPVTRGLTACGRAGLRAALSATLAGACAGAWGMTCAPETSGYTVGAGVTYFLKDPSPNSTRQIQRALPMADPGSFELLHLPLHAPTPCGARRVEFGKDKARVYYRWQVIAGADPKTYAFIDSHYARDRSAVYSGTKRLTTRVGSFRTVGAYATDGRQNFYRDAVIPGTSFKLLGGEAQSSRGYAVTASHVYHNGQAVARADPGSFELFKPEVGITRDRRFVFFNHVVVPGADPTTFEQVNGYTFKDKTGVYTEGKKIDGAQAASIRATEFGSYLIDSAAVFRHGKPLPNRDPATFVELQPQWSKDRSAVYYNDEAVPQIDSASFKATSLNRGEDRNHRYEGTGKVCKFRADDASALPLCL